MANVMVVEDNAVYRDLVHLLCQMDGHNVVDARDAEEALELLQADSSPKSIDLFIVDFRLGALTGRDFVEMVREGDRFQDTPILMLSALDEGLGGFAARRKIEMLRKPADNAEVVAAIRRLLPPWSPGLSKGSSHTDWA